MPEQILRCPPPPELPDDAHKGSAGRLLCLCGSESMPGAALLVARAALRAGAGLVTVGVTSRELVRCLAPAVPEATYLDLAGTAEGDPATDRARRVADHVHDARVVGPGLGSGEDSRALVRALLAGAEFPGPSLWDADGLNALGGEPELLAPLAGPVVLTPHPGEAARLLGQRVPADDAGRLECALALAARSGGVCVLKGARTVVSDGRRFFRCEAGNCGMATAGAGDVLSGVLGAYLLSSARVGEEFDAFAAACAAVQVHGLAGDMAASSVGRRGLIASDLIDRLGPAQLAHQTRAREEPAG